MESSSKFAAGHSGSRPGIPTSSRMQRNLAEKERRDKLNGFISELATLIPMVSNAVKPLDKVSILRLAAAEMRLHFSCLNPKKYKKKPLVLPPAVMSSLDLIEKTTGGFVMVTTLTGVIVFCSRSIEDYLGYQNIDVMGNKAVKYIYEADIKYFESKFSSVVNSWKKANKKKTKAFKSHMLQKPLPRSSETCRPRNMIFKFSVHQNDTSGNNGSSNLIAKNQPQKDFGYSAVVLMFIEPVRFEPEVDTTYIDINQDIYFTRHGLQGEIIYADQRISTITGYMAYDVQGTSAYKYISQSDIPLALFAQKAMFTSPDGKGVIVYRLRIRDMRCIYLQSTGQIVYKDSSNEISHFVCFNKLLSEEEGSQELKKFQQRYAPQIMAAKMLQVQKNPGNHSPTTDLAFEQVMRLLNPSSNTNSPSSVQSNSLTYSNTSTPDALSSITDKNQSEMNVSPGFSAEPNFVHSSEDPFTSIPINKDLSSPAVLNPTPSYEEDMDVILEIPGQRSGGGPLRRRDSAISSLSSPYKTVTNDKKGKASEQLKNCLNKVDPEVMNESFYSVNKPNQYGSNANAAKQLHQNSQYITIKSQNRAVHFVNVNNNLFSDSNGFSDAHKSHSMVFDPALSQKITLQITAPAPHFNGQSNGPITDLSQQYTEYLRCKESASVNNHQLGGSFEAVSNVLYDDLDLIEEQNPVSHISHTEDISGLYDASSVSSLQNNSNFPVLSELYTDVAQCHNFNSYPDIDSCNNYQFSSSISNNNNGANIGVHNDLDNFNSEIFTVGEMNGIHEAITSLNKLKSVPPMEIFDSMKSSAETPSLWSNPQKNKVDFMDINASGTVSTRTIDINQNNSINALSSNNGHELPPSAVCNDVLSGFIESEDASLNKELYSELSLFFQNLPELNASQSSAVIKEISEFPVDSCTYSSNNISPESQTFYHQ